MAFFDDFATAVQNYPSTSVTLSIVDVAVQTGTAGEVKPIAGSTGTLEWAWTNPPVSPVTFTYTLNVPAGQSGAKTLTATGYVRSGGPELVLPARTTGLWSTLVQKAEMIANGI